MADKVRADRLLGREAIHINGPNAKALADVKTVLAAGAGGSITSETVRQMTVLAAGKVSCVDHVESALCALQRGRKGAALLNDDAYRPVAFHAGFLKRTIGAPHRRFRAWVQTRAPIPRSTGGRGPGHR